MTPSIDALPMEEIDRLEALAKAAEGWGWHEDIGVFFAGNTEPTSTSKDYWRHATACSPEQMLALCAQARRTVTAEASRDEWKQLCDDGAKVELRREEERDAAVERANCAEAKAAALREELVKLRK